MYSVFIEEVRIVLQGNFSASNQQIHEQKVYCASRCTTGDYEKWLVTTEFVRRNGTSHDVWSSFEGVFVEDNLYMIGITLQEGTRFIDATLRSMLSPELVDKKTQYALTLRLSLILCTCIAVFSSFVFILSNLVVICDRMSVKEDSATSTYVVRETC